MKGEQKEQQCVNHLMMHSLTLKNLLLVAKILSAARKSGNTSLNQALEDVIKELLVQTLVVLRSRRFKAGPNDAAVCNQSCQGDACESSWDEDEESEEEDEDDSSSDSISASVMPFTTSNARKVMWKLIPVLLLVALIVQCLF